MAPPAGVVGFPRVRAGRGVDTARFYEALLADHGTYVGRATGSSSTTATSGSATAGPTEPSCGAGSAA